MARTIIETKRFLVDWGRKGGRMEFFIQHKELPETFPPVPCSPEDLSQKMVELANKIDSKRATKRKDLNIKSSGQFVKCPFGCGNQKVIRLISKDETKLDDIYRNEYEVLECGHEKFVRTIPELVFSTKSISLTSFLNDILPKSPIMR